MTTHSPPPDRSNRPSDELSGEQVVGLHESALQCGALLEEGLRLLEDYRGEPESRNAMLANLSQGFEHLLKLTLWLFDEDEQSIGRNHKIPALLDRLLRIVPPESMPPGRHEFLQHDRRFRELMQMLGKYGGAGKYDSLDAAIGRDTSNESDQSPSEMWEEMKLDLLDEDWFELMQRDPAGFSARFYTYLYEVVAASLAYGIHSLWWLWVHGSAAERGRQWHPALTNGPWHRVNMLTMGHQPG